MGPLGSVVWKRKLHSLTPSVCAFLVAQEVKESAFSAGEWDSIRVKKILRRRAWQPTQVVFPGEVHG